MARKKPTSSKTRKIETLDDLLAMHLEKAEEHLIAAVKLFEKKNRPDRTVGYQERLVRAQELCTMLFREELIRIRGPIKVPRRKK